VRSIITGPCVNYLKPGPNTGLIEKCFPGTVSEENKCVLGQPSWLWDSTVISTGALQRVQVLLILWWVSDNEACPARHRLIHPRAEGPRVDKLAPSGASRVVRASLVIAQLGDNGTSDGGPTRAVEGLSTGPHRPGVGTHENHRKNGPAAPAVQTRHTWYTIAGFGVSSAH
jgi:hypothetical protein